MRTGRPSRHVVLILPGHRITEGLRFIRQCSSTAVIYLDGAVAERWSRDSTIGPRARGSILLYTCETFIVVVYTPNDRLNMLQHNLFRVLSPNPLVPGMTARFLARDDLDGVGWYMEPLRTRDSSSKTVFSYRRYWKDWTKRSRRQSVSPWMTSECWRRR